MESKLKYFILAAIFLVFPALALAGCGADQAAANPQIAAINMLRTGLELPKTPLEFFETTMDSNSPTGI